MAAHTIPAEELTPSVSVTEQEYLRTSYEPDCDYLDGRVEERNVGEYEHSGVQGAILNIFFNHGAQWASRRGQSVVCKLRQRNTVFPM